MKQPSLLVISGSDSCGGAGMQADIKTATLLGVYAVSALTAVTAQNSHGIRSIVSIEPDMLERQISVVLEDVSPDAVKIGMLPSFAHVELLAALLRKYNLRNVVVDPILAASSGDMLNDNREKTAECIFKELMPLATVVTPNIPEAKFYLDIAGCKTPENGDSIARLFLERCGSESVVLKGGHSDSEFLTDILCFRNDGDARILEASAPKIHTTNLHGTGCVFSTAMATFLASGVGLTESFTRAHEFVHERIVLAVNSYPYEGYGPLYLFP